MKGSCFSKCVIKGRDTVLPIVPKVVYMMGVHLTEEHDLYGNDLIVAIGHDGNRNHSNPCCAFVRVNKDWLPVLASTPVNQPVQTPERKEMVDVPWFETKAKNLVKEAFGATAVIMWRHRDSSRFRSPKPPSTGLHINPLVGTIPRRATID